MAGIIGIKLGMSSFFNKEGKSIPCTMVQAGPCVITQIKNNETDGYAAVQLGFLDKKTKQSTKSQIGHAKKANTKAKKVYGEFKNDFTIGISRL